MYCGTWYRGLFYLVWIAGVYAKVFFAYVALTAFFWEAPVVDGLDVSGVGTAVPNRNRPVSDGAD